MKKIPKGCNASFFTFIPKILNPKSIKDFRLISLIGCQYKIIGKLLSNRLSEVISPVVSGEQSAFIKDRQILDGPFILNEVVAWAKAKKKQLMISKVDFEKAFDSLSHGIIYWRLWILWVLVVVGLGQLLFLLGLQC